MALNWVGHQLWKEAYPRCAVLFPRVAGPFRVRLVVLLVWVSPVSSTCARVDLQACGLVAFFAVGALASDSATTLRAPSVPVWRLACKACAGVSRLETGLVFSRDTKWVSTSHLCVWDAALSDPCSQLF